MVVMPKQNVPALRLEGFSGEWGTVSLDELQKRRLVTLGRGEVISQIDINAHPGNYPIYSSSAKNDGLFGRYGRYMFSDERITWSIDGGGQFFYRPAHRYSVTNVCGWMKINTNTIDTSFLYLALYLQWLEQSFDYSAKAHPSNIVQIYNPHFPPTLEEQQAIGAIFTNLDAAINQHMLKHKALQQSKTALMQRMFPQEGQTVPELRLEGFSGEWEPVRLDAFDIKTGPFGSTLHAEDYVAVGTPIVTTEHFKSGQLPDTGDSIPQVSKQDTARLSMYLLDEGDIVFSRVGSVDINAQVTRHQKGWLFSGRVLRLRLDASCDAAFLHSALETEQVRTSIISRAVGQTMPSINTKILAATEVFIPPTLEEQQAIGAVFTNLDQLIAAEAQYIASLKQAKTALLQRMFI